MPFMELCFVLTFFHSFFFFYINLKKAHEGSGMLCVCIFFRLFTFFFIILSPQILLIATWCVKLLL